MLEGLLLKPVGRTSKYPMEWCTVSGLGNKGFGLSQLASKTHSRGSGMTVKTMLVKP